MQKLIAAAGVLMFALFASLPAFTQAAPPSASNNDTLPVKAIIAMDFTKTSGSVPRPTIHRIIGGPNIADMPRTLAAPFQMDGIAPRLAGPAPELGADTDAILGEAGFTAAEIRALKAAGAAA